MSCWYDERANRYRTSLPYKIFYVWSWPLILWVLQHCMTVEQAHWFSLHVGIRFVGFVDRVWKVIVFFTVFPILVLLVLCKRRTPR